MIIFLEMEGQSPMYNRKAFTIVELLVSLVIIALLVSILLPSFAMIRRMAKETAQKSQFTTMDMALDAFKQDYGDYPPSDWPDLRLAPPLRTSYCGAQKLAEALVGWDLMGFDPNSAWRADGLDALGLGGSYDPLRTRMSPPPAQPLTLFERKGPYLELATAGTFRLGDLFNTTTPLDPCTFVLCDVFRFRKTIDNAGKPVIAGTPILYYKANINSRSITTLPLETRIYDYRHNRPLIDLQKLTAKGTPGKLHPLGYPVGNDFPIFYSDTYSPYPTPLYGGSGVGYGIRDPKVTQNPWPYRPDTYILISAGVDGLYGTADDIHN
jgi:prepilin-type N-terminal cleavage/methylation domain-containing protein